MSAQKKPYATRATDFLRDLCMTKLYSDVNLVVNDEEIPAHRNILAAHSEIFHNVFTSKESKSYRLSNLSTSDFATFKLVLR